MDTSISSPAIITSRFLSRMRPLNPAHEPPEDTEPPVLDLCIRKRNVSTCYPYDYMSSKSRPTYVEPTLPSSPQSQSSVSETSEVSSSEMRDHNSNLTGTKIKPNRPFKAYPKDPLSIALIGTTAPNILGKDSSEAYAEFREKMLSYVQASHNGTNKNMRRMQSQNPLITDPTYWEKRKKNNEAAKRSRDARRAKEDEIAIRCAFLEQENLQLRFRVAELESEKQRLQNLVFH